MATCKCGNTKGWADVECSACAEVSARERNVEHLATIGERLPNVVEYCKRYEGMGWEFQGAFVEDLTPDIEIVEYAGGISSLILTPTSIMKWEMNMANSRVKQKEVMPLAAVTGFEANSPTKSAPTLWKFRITRASNVDEIYVIDGPNVRPFIDAVNSALAGGSRNTGSTAPSVADKIKSLGELKEAGLLTEEEFAEKKAQLLKDL